jgi:hypothetical protein
MQVDEATVSFRYKDYKAGGAVKLMTLSNQEFTRRFAQHILPQRFVRIRHYGLLSSTWRRASCRPFRQNCRLKENNNP